MQIDNTITTECRHQIKNIISFYNDRPWREHIGVFARMAGTHCVVNIYIEGVVECQIQNRFVPARVSIALPFDHILTRCSVSNALIHKTLTFAQTIQDNRIAEHGVEKESVTHQTILSRRSRISDDYNRIHCNRNIGIASKPIIFNFNRQRCAGTSMNY